MTDPGIYNNLHVGTVLYCKTVFAAGRIRTHKKSTKFEKNDTPVTFRILEEMALAVFAEQRGEDVLKRLLQVSFLDRGQSAVSGFAEEEYANSFIN